MCALDYPAGSSQTLASLHSAPRDAKLDAAHTALRPAAAVAITLVGMQPVLPSPQTATPR